MKIKGRPDDVTQRLGLLDRGGHSAQANREWEDGSYRAALQTRTSLVVIPLQQAAFCFESGVNGVRVAGR